MKSLAILGFVLATAFLLAAPVSALAYTVTVATSSRSYASNATIQITGQVSPAPGPGTVITIRIFNQNGALVTADEVTVNGTTGSYSGETVAGGSSNWVDGNYVVNATWGAYGPTIFAITTFSWSSTATSTSTTSTTSSTTSTSSSTSATTSSTSTTLTATTSSSSLSSSTTTATSSQTTSSSSSIATSSTTSSSSASTTSGGIPEFPYQVLAVMALSLLVAASYFLVRRRSRIPATPGVPRIHKSYKIP